MPPTNPAAPTRDFSATCEAALRFVIVQAEAAPEQGIPEGANRLDLRDLVTRRKLELLHGVDQPIDDGFLRRDVDILEAPGD
jgi:hypothetical protein